MAGPLRKELQAYRTSKNADLKLDGGFFYRRSVPSKSASYHGTYTDLYDNADDIHTIEGGMKPRYSQFDTTLPDKPTYGSSKLSGLYFAAKIQNNDYLNPATSTTSAGEGVGFKAFKIDSLIDTEGGNSDGSTMIDNEDILAFSTYFTASPPHEAYNDVFDGVGEESTTVVKQGQLVVQKEAYLTLDDAHAMGRYYGKKESRLLAKPMSKSTYFKNFGEMFNGEQIVRIFRMKQKAAYALGGYLIGDEGTIRYATCETKTGLTGKKRHDTFKIRGMLRSKIKYKDTNTIPTTASPYTVSRTNVVTTTNSTLHTVKEARTFNELTSTGGTKEIAWGKIGFSSESVHEGGQSIKMHTFWPALANQDGWRKSSIYYPADSSNNHTHQRQECYITKRIPVPITYQDQYFSSGSSVKIPQVVSTKINIKKLANCESKHYRRVNAPVAIHSGTPTVDNANISGQTVMSRIFTRGIAICFSEFPPGYSDATTKSQDDTFYTFIKTHHPGMESTTAADRDNGAKDFYGVFLANEAGVLTVNPLGSAAATDYLTFLTDSKTHKIGTNTAPSDTVNISDDDLGDKWLKFDFIIDPETNGTTLIICDGDDGKAIKRVRIHNSSATVTTGHTQNKQHSVDSGGSSIGSTFPRYMSIWNVNTVNPNSGISAADGDHGPFANATSSTRDNFKGFSDTGLVFESAIGDHDDDDSTPETRATSFNPVHGALTKMSVSDFQTGDSSGTMEKYWALVAGSEFYFAYNDTSTTYGRSTSENQYVSEAMFETVALSTDNITVPAGSPILVRSSAPIDGGAEPGTDMENIVYVDSIKVHNAVPEIENASVHNENKSAGLIRIPATHKTYTTTYADVDAYNGSNEEGPMVNDTWSYLSFGFKNKTDFEGAAKHFLLSGFNSNNPRNNVEPLHNKDSHLSHIRAGYLDDDTVLGGSVGDAMFQNSDGTPDPGNENGLIVFPLVDGVGFARELDLELTSGVKNFTMKGFFKLEFDERTSEAATSRENPYCSARIVDIIDASNGIIEVDNEDIFKLDLDEEYIMYSNGASYGTANYLTGLKIIEKEAGILTFNKTLVFADSGAALLTNQTRDNIFISPKRFWLTIAILNKSANDNNSYLPERSYESIVGVTGVHTIGATYNEYKFSTDSSYYKFKRNMDPFTNLESNDIRLDVDFGFGATSDDVPDEAGHAGLLHLPLSTSLDDAAVDNVRIDMSGIVTALKPEFGSTLPIMLTPLSSTNTATLKIFAEEASNEYDKPYLITEFEDELPEIDDFKVEPDMDNPFFPKYTWSCGADDAWYGFLNIDSKSITNQYHNAVIHVPMNEEDRHAKHPATPSLEKIQGLTNADSGVLKNLEGLAGYCLEFDGNNDWVEINAAAGSDPTADCTKEMTVLIHMIPDADTDERYIVAQSHVANKKKFHLNLNASNQVVARVWWGTGDNDYTELTSSTIVPNDGETPTAVMLVVDTEIDSGNVKLYLNGNLEDLSGQTSASGGANNWKAGQNINGGNSEIFIGNSSGTGTNGFNGKLEELVIYKKALYPFSGKETELKVTKPFVEIDDSGSTASLPITAKVFIKDYHNIRGSSAEQVATAPQVTYRKAAFRLDNS